MRTVPTPAFPDDDGSADPELAAAVEAQWAGRGDPAELIARLRSARLLVPVVAVLDDAESSGPATGTEKDSHMAAVLTTGRDGRTGLLAFTATATMARWDPAARPVAVPGGGAARAALDEGAAALVVDLAGPRPFVVERPELDVLAGDERGPDPLRGW